jgi:hypothetical protein
LKRIGKPKINKLMHQKYKLKNRPKKPRYRRQYKNTRPIMRKDKNTKQVIKPSSSNH